MMTFASSLPFERNRGFSVKGQIYKTCRWFGQVHYKPTATVGIALGRPASAAQHNAFGINSKLSSPAENEEIATKARQKLTDAMRFIKGHVTQVMGAIEWF